MNINKALMKAYEGKPLKEIVNSPIDVLQGVTKEDAEKLREAFNIKTVKDMANNKFFQWARAICTLAETEE